MLRKLLKYDFKEIMKLWWIVALACVLLSLVGAGCMRIQYSERPLPEIITFVAGLSATIVRLCMLGFVVAVWVISYGRYYKNFFTDEGYLTFTLPVTCKQLLDSKLITQLTVSALSALVYYGCSLLMNGLGKEGYFSDMIRVSSAVNEVDTAEVIWTLVYVVEAYGIATLCSLFSILFTDLCITFGSMIAKRAKLLVSIAVYLGANWLFSGIVLVFLLFGSVSLVSWMNTINPDQQTAYVLVFMMLFCVIAVMGLLCSILYTMIYWMLDRKLNLP